jgi:PleD family two-component response regulator
MDTAAEEVVTGRMVRAVMKQADKLLYAAKNSGRNNIQKAYFDPIDIFTHS